MFTCGYCGSGVSAEEKWKQLKNGTPAKYIYYGCGRGKDRNCQNKYIREEELIAEIQKIIDVLDINELGMRQKLEDEIVRFNIFRKSVLGDSSKSQNNNETGIINYAKYVLQSGSISDKRELLANIESVVVYKNKELYIK